MTRKKVYLTIDDAPTRDFKKKVEYLAERDIPALIFCLGEELLKFLDDAIYAIQKGFVLGNHGMHHNFFSDMSLQECMDSISGTDEILNNLYNKAGVDRCCKYFRFPYFDQGGFASSVEYKKSGVKNDDKKTKLQNFLRSLGYSQPDFMGISLENFKDQQLLEYADVRCTFSQMEYFLNKSDAPNGLSDPEIILKRVDIDDPDNGLTLNRVDRSDIILIHDQVETTELFFRIIDRYIDKDFNFQVIPG